MSIYSSSSKFTNCSGDQSPINLSQATAKPCDLLCELVMDTGLVSQALVYEKEHGLILEGTTTLGSCKYNNQGYTCKLLIVNHPSHHTIEDIKGDGEVIAVFENPSGKFLCVSSLFKVNSAESPSTHFFNSFIPYIDGMTRVNLGDNWSLSMMMPTNKGYFVYDGTFPALCSTKVKWVVNKSMINIDANTFALLTKKTTAGSRPIQPIGNREIFFNDIQNDYGVPRADGDKRYMRFKLVGKLKDAVNSIQKPKEVDLKEAASKQNKNISDKIVEFITGQVQTNGVMYYVSWTLFAVALLIGIYAGTKMFFIGTYILDFHQNLPGYLWSILTFWYNLAMWVVSKLTKKPDQTV